MIKSKLKYAEVSKIILLRFIPAMIIILLLGVAKHFILQYEINRNLELTNIINISGRQRMLSQKITKDAYALYLSVDEGSTKFYINELKNSSEEWEKTNINLKNGIINENDKNINNSKKIKELFDHIEGNHQEMLLAAKSIINMFDSLNYNEETLKKYINILNNNESYYLNGMNDIVYQYENESNNKIKIVGRTENILSYLTLVMVVFITLFIFIPAEKGLLKAFKDIKESNDNMMKLFKTVHGAMFLIDEKTEEVLFMNKSAEKLIEVNNSATNSIYFQEIFKLKSDAFYKVMDKIKLYEKNENVEFKYGNTDSGVGTFILSSVKMNFNNKPAILIGLFDITEQKQAEENFRNIAIKDKLTGLYNRYYFDLRVNDEIIISDRYNEPLTMILLDLDHFKNINDTWGHPVGDIVLKETAEIISSTIRKSDYVFRVGGEEFVVLMPKTEINDALVLADKIRVEVENNDYSVAKKVTVSIGAAQKYKSESLDNWYTRTDKALYFAKESGRNCVVNYENMNNKIIAFAHIEWSNQWDSKNMEIDNQHKKFIELANTLLFMGFSNSKMDKIIKQLDLLIDHIMYHFSFEEKLLSEIGYPNYEEHIVIHKELLKKSLNLREAYINEKFSVTEFFSFVVDDVVLGHLIKEDEKFFDLIRNY